MKRKTAPWLPIPGAMNELREADITDAMLMQRKAICM
jgi:hypothetical protein